MLGPLLGHTGRVQSVAFSPDGRYIVSGSSDGTIRIWEAGRGTTVVGPLQAHQGLTGTWSVAFSPDGKRVVSGGDDGLIKIWNAMVY
jgi:WD40 repeat protein